MEMIEVPCNLCKAKEFEVVYPSKYAGEVNVKELFSASKGQMSKDQVVRCRKCGLVFANPRFSEKDIIDAYSSGDDEVYVSQEENRIKTFRRSLAFLEKYSKRGKILDVGAAAGFFLAAAKEDGWETYGVEPSAWMTDYGNRKFGLKVRQGTLREAKLQSGTFDVVTMWDVLEHTFDPMSELAEANRILAKEGIIVVNYPDFDSIFSKIFRRKWWFVLSVHLYYFTPKTMEAMLEKTGFEVIVSKRYWQSLSFGYLVGMINHLSKNPLAKIAYRVLKVFSDLGLKDFPVKYYAGQRLMIARKR